MGFRSRTFVSCLCLAVGCASVVHAATPAETPCLPAAPVLAPASAADPAPAPSSEQLAARLRTLLDDVVSSEAAAAPLAGDGPASGEGDIELSSQDDPPDWTATFGGSARVRLQRESNRDLMGTLHDHDNFGLLQLRLHGDLRHRDGVRVFVEGIAARIEHTKATPQPTDRDRADLLSAFVEIPGEGVTGRVGRLPLEYGAGRLISPLEWANVPRRFQGGVVSLENGDVTTDVLLVKPVVISPRNEDQADSSQWLGGVYNTWTLGEEGSEEPHGLDLYGLMLSESADVLLPGATGTPGDMRLYTFGGRYWGRRGAGDYEFEAAIQRGDRAGADIDAGMYSVALGYTMEDCCWRPRLGWDFDFASGDDKVADDTYGTFNQLFPNSHDYLGQLDIVGRQNVNAFSPNVTLQTSPTTSLKVAFWDLEMADTHDFVYGPNGTPISPAGALGTGGKDIGQEIDVTLRWDPAGSPVPGQFLFGYSEIDPAKAIDVWGNGNKAHLLFAQYRLPF